MSDNRKIHYGDNHGVGINQDITPPVEPSPEGAFTFDRMDITFDSLIRTFDEL